MIRLVAAAKLTVALRVLGLRPDGLHELSAEMVSLDLADELELDPEGDGLEVVTGSPATSGLPEGAENLVARALAAAGRSAAVRLVKRIPVGGGLGGGSTDAAAILRWAGVTDPVVAASLGADVAFCVVGGRAEVTGAGERVRPLAFRERAFTLLLPPFGMDTGAVYRSFDRTGVLGDGGPNDLTGAALALEPRLARWRDRLGDATGRSPVLAGSGSTWFVEGHPEEVGLGGRDALELRGERATVLAARTVRAVPVGPRGDGVADPVGPDGA